MKKLLCTLTGLAFATTTVQYSRAGHDPVVVFEPGFEVPKKKRTKVGSLDPDGPDTVFEIVTEENTEAITDAMTFAIALCSGGAAEYLVSCLGDQLADIAASLPANGDYAESAKILEQAGAKLQTLARQNRARSKPTIRYSAQTDNRTVTTGPLVAVSTESLPSVNQQAEAILQEAETLLLRSVSNSDRRKSHYAAMAAVVGSSKVLLRSL